MKTKFKISILFILFFLQHLSFAQNSQIDSLKRVLQITKIDTARVNIFNHIATKFQKINPDSTLLYTQKANKLSQKIKYNFGLANSTINLGNSNILKGNYKIAATYFEKAIQQFIKLVENDNQNKQFKNGLARSYSSLGIIYSRQSNYGEAIDNYQKALPIYIEIDQKTNLSKCYNNIGVVYKSQRNLPKALEYFSKALKIQQQNGEETEAVTLTNIGVLYFEQNNAAKADEYYKKAKTLYEKINNPTGFALLYNYLGDFYKKQNTIPEAIKSYSKALELYESVQDKFGASLALYNLGQTNFEQNNYPEAMQFASKSLVYAKELGVIDQTFHSEKLLSEIYEAQGKQGQSLLHYKNYIVARDSISKMETSKKFLEAEMNFEYKKKEALLNEKSKRQNQLILFSILGGLLLIGSILLYLNRMQVKKRLTLQKEVAEYEQKALHLQMNPHFVFNCLGSISSFIVQNGTDSALKYLSKFSKLMRLTLEYSKGALIPIDKEVESLQNYLELEQLRFNDSFKFSIKTTDKVEFNMGIPPLLIQPFVENAILHGLVPKGESGKIDITFDVQNSQLICIIADNGIGISKSKEMKENSVQAHKSMALEITKKRLEIMEATISKSAQIDIVEDNGTKVTLRLPVQYMQ